MDLWKTLAFASMMFAGSQVAANENASPVDRMTMHTTLGPSVLSAWSTNSTGDAQKPFRAAKADALVFIGSDGEIRGAQFEQASRHYRSTYKSPLMNDMQLAQAIASAF